VESSGSDREVPVLESFGTGDVAALAQGAGHSVGAHSQVITRTHREYGEGKIATNAPQALVIRENPNGMRTTHSRNVRMQKISRQAELTLHLSARSYSRKSAAICSEYFLYVSASNREVV
jgi:hypothetical protein